MGLDYRPDLDTFRVSANSMYPAFRQSERVVADLKAYRSDLPRRGDVVVFHSPHDGTIYLKRIVGLPGEAVAVVDRELLINGKPLGGTKYTTEEKRQLREAATPYFKSVSDLEFSRESLGEETTTIIHDSSNEYTKAYVPITLKPDQYFMMGDNRDFSFDSRFWGSVERDAIVGKVLFTYWPYPLK